MTALTSIKPWDLSHALELNNTNLSSPEQSRQPATQPPASPQQSNGSDEFHDSGIDEGVDKMDFAKKPSGGLGDFTKMMEDKIWETLGIPAPDVRRSSNELSYDIGRVVVQNVQDYTSDGATYVNPASRKLRGVTWKDQEESADETAGSTTDHSASPDAPELKLTKTQRKKQNRKERKAQEAALAAKRGAMSENEADDPQRTTPARKASAHGSTSTPTQQYAPYELPGFVRSNSASAASKGLFPASVAPPKKKENKFKPSKTEAELPSTPLPKRLDATKRHLSQPATTTPVKNAQAAALYEIYNQDNKQAPLATPNFKGKQSGPPATAQPQRKKDVSDPFMAEIEAAKQAVAAKTGTPIASTPSKRPNAIEPRIIRSGEDKHWALFLRLLNEHPKERSYLVSPMPMVNHSNDPKGAHVFIDASNIFIGFNDQLKRERGIPVHWHTGNSNISFDALALLMERRRPVAKRVLVGSFPEVPAFTMARKVGYEVCLLDKVYKARELTDRQIYFKEQDALRNSKRNGAKAPVTPAAAAKRSPSFGGSETTAGKEREPQFAPAKMIEQGVDEILHLKILESVVDNDEPATMVIATGDAAQAEYSDGFMAMVLRALKKGWKVELVSWSANISKMYLRREFRDQWGENFKTVFLDDFAEELLDM
jgi:hypothetical protein